METINDIVRDMRKRFEPYAKSDSNDARYVAYLGYAEFADCKAAFGKYWIEKSHGGKGCSHPFPGWGKKRAPALPKMPRRPRKTIQQDFLG